MERWARQHPEVAQQFANAYAYLLHPAERPQAAPPGPEAHENDDQALPGLIPGGFVGDVMEEQEAGSGEEGEESEGEEERPFLPVRIARGFMSMFWGGSRPENESDSEEDTAANPAGTGGGRLDVD